MKKFYFAIIILAGFALTGLSGCFLNCVHGSGNSKTVTRKPGDFEGIEISGGYKVILKQDSSYGIKITADDNLLKYIKTNVHGGMLHIYNKRSFCDEGEMTIYIGVGKLEEVRTSGAIDLEGDGHIKTDNLSIHSSGDSRINMDLTAANVKVDGSGHTELHLKGTASSLSTDMSGSSNIQAFDLAVGNCEISTSGSGESEVNVSTSLHISSSGSSSVKYKGNPSIANDKSGASTVEKVD
jgi:hypothetical protein